MQMGLIWFVGLKDELRKYVAIRRRRGVRIPRSLAEFDIAVRLSSRALKDVFILQGMSADSDGSWQYVYSNVTCTVPVHISA